MNANVFITKDYENETTLRPKKTNPIQTQSRYNSGAKGTLGGLANLLIDKLEN